jgi:DNA-binding NtrC family response regulator
MHLQSADRSFFRLVGQAAFSNPFSEERDELDREVARVTGDVPDLIAAVTERVSTRLLRVEVEGRIDLSHYETGDRSLLRHAILFDAFHQFIPQLDRFIHEEEPATSIRVPFAEELRGLLLRRGFVEQDAHRYLELFYQLRRAHRFIGQAFVGTGAKMRQLRESLWNNLFTQDATRYERHLWDRMQDFSTILIGGTGTGKSAAAEAMGKSGFIPFDRETQRFASRPNDIFLPVSLSEFPESLIESELFGHRKGAFTGAIENHEGWLTRCGDHGTIFLDEIGELSLHSQVKLLRVLQDRTFTPVGGHTQKRFEGRVMAATHRSLAELRQRGDFRDDLYYRLSSDVIVLPSLREQLDERPEVLSELVEHVVAKVIGEPSPELGASVSETIEREKAEYAWPGNVRELAQCVRRVLLKGTCVELTATSHASPTPSAFALSIQAGGLNADELLAGYCSMLYEESQSFRQVAARTQLDPRTVKKYILQHHASINQS